MSNDSYGKWWIIAKKNLEKVKSYDDEMKTMPAVKERILANELIGGLYARYCLVVQELDTCLDQMCQIQKSFAVRKLMDAATTRLNELKDEMLKIDLSEYHYVDGTLIELKIIPQSIEVLHPMLKYPRPFEYGDLWNKIKKGEQIYFPSLTNTAGVTDEKEKSKPKKKTKIDPLALLQKKSEEKSSKVTFANNTDEKLPEVEEIIESVKETDNEESAKKGKRKRNKVKKTFIPETVQLTEEEKEAQRRKERLTEAIVLIQKLERARQARLYYNDLHSDISASKAAADPRIPKPAPINPTIKDHAVLTIQSGWKGYRDRNIMRKREIQRRIIIGMVQKSYNSEEEKIKFENNLERRRSIRDEKLREYIKKNLDEKERVLKVIGPGLFEDIGDELREWMSDWYYRGYAFQEIPPEELGGSVLIVRCEVESVDEYLEASLAKNKKKKEQKTKDQIEKENKANQDKLKKEKERKIQEAKLKKKAALKGNLDVKVTDTIAHNKFLEGFKMYQDLSKNINIIDDSKNLIHMNVISEEKCYELQLSIRKEVDKLMRLELEMLQLAFARDKWKSKGKKGKFKSKKKKKKKKAKKEKKVKTKKDPTGHRKVEDILQELIDNGIVRTYPKAQLCDFFGDMSYQNWEKRNLSFDPPPALGDVRQTIVLNCILPLGVEEMQKPKSVLIVGPRKSGKHLLANAIFSETNCVLFDLSPNILAGKYPGKKGSEMLVHLVNKMSKLLQPSIILIDQVEKTFYKKVPKDEASLEPKKAGKFLFKKIIKPIKPQDRIMVLGLTREPWLASRAQLNKTFQRIILIPRTDYGSVFLYWQNLLMRYHAVDRNFDVSSLAKLTEFYPLSELKNAVTSTLVPRRIIELSYKPLQQRELLSCLLQGKGPVNDKEYGKFIGWYKKTPIGRQRTKLNALAEQRRAKESKGKKRR